MFKKISGGICCFFAVGGAVALVSGTTKESLIIVICLIAFFVLAAIFLFPAEKRKEKRGIKNEQHMVQLKTCTMKHVNGLLIAENAEHGIRKNICG